MRHTRGSCSCFERARRRRSIDTIITLERRLNDFDYARRMAALAELVDLAARGRIELASESAVVNMHCHTFFSYNAYGYSPAALAWLAKVRGFYAVGIVDFDVLDAVDEFMAACDLAGVRGSAGIETRTIVPQFATREINSPGEPGVYYHMGIGFTSGRAPDRSSAAVFAEMRDRAQRRNREMLARINRHLAPIAIEYDCDVIPMTPSGNVTERHMLQAILRTVRAHFEDDATRTTELSFWSDKLSLPADQIAATIDDPVKFFNLVRSKLMKKGGVGYVTPTPEAYPSVEEVSQATQACGALPCATWLDGVSAGEQDFRELLELLIDRGAAALNIVPDRNWNIADPGMRRLKVAKLHEVVRLAAEFDLPLNVGTEMNAPGNKLIDDFDAPEMAPLRDAFLDGASFVYGHTVMQRGLGLGYQSAWAAAHLPTRRERNAFYAEIGRRVPPGAAGRAALTALGANLTPQDLLVALI